MSVTIHNGDCRAVLKGMADESVHCVVTSPPYFGLRDYGVDGQIGLETSPDAFVAELVAVFAEVRRVLRDDGTLWLNLGDSYAGGGHGGGGSFEKERNWRAGNPEKNKGASNRDGLGRVTGLKPKDLIGIPWRVAFALQADGWYLRQDIIWSKPNPMPESVRDRCTKAHEYIFMLTKSARYFYDADAIKEPSSWDPDKSKMPDGWDTGPGGHGSFHRNGREKGARTDKQRGHSRRHAGFNDRWDAMEKKEQCSGLRNKRSVWEVATAPFSEAHFATFPPALIEPCIKAGCPERCCVRCGAPWARETERLDTQNRTAKNGEGNGQLNKSGRFGDPQRMVGGLVPTCECPFDYTTARGVVLDPFGGAGTTGLVADRLQRNAILIELNPQYAEMARRRIQQDAGMFGGVAA
jgi:DNA modification methylase